MGAKRLLGHSDLEHFVKAPFHTSYSTTVRSSDTDQPMTRSSTPPDLPPPLQVVQIYLFLWMATLCSAEFKPTLVKTDIFRYSALFFSSVCWPQKKQHITRSSVLSENVELSSSSTEMLIIGCVNSLLCSLR
jgi:hypothetical protein